METIPGNIQLQPPTEDIARQDAIYNDRQKELLEVLISQELSEEQKAEITRRFAGLVDTIVAWADESHEDVEQLVPLGGGFKNPVLLITTSSGRQVVAKGFTEEESLTTTRHAKSILDGLIEEDMKIIPDSDIFDDTLFSEKAKGSPVRGLLRELSTNPELFDRTAGALAAVGSTLGMIHERTERPISDESDMKDGTLEAVNTDTEKALRHINELEVAKLTGLTPEELEVITANITNLTMPEFVSLVHGDAHLDQFFHEEGGSTVEIVDYDDLREGDPMADLGRLIASQRDWCRLYGIDPETEMKLTRAIVLGYESARKESDLLVDAQELDVMRVVAYELRLHLVKLKNYTELRTRLEDIGSSIGMSESEILSSDPDTREVVLNSLSEEEKEQYLALRTLTAEIDTIMNYLKPVNEENDLEDITDDSYKIAA